MLRPMVQSSIWLDDQMVNHVANPTSYPAPSDNPTQVLESDIICNAWNGFGEKPLIQAIQNEYDNETCDKKSTYGWYPVQGWYDPVGHGHGAMSNSCGPETTSQEFQLGASGCRMPKKLRWQHGRSWLWPGTSHTASQYVVVVVVFIRGSSPIRAMPEFLRAP